MLNDRENILSALREKPLKVYEIMKRANVVNEEACQSLLLKMRDEGLVRFDIHEGRGSSDDPLNWVSGATGGSCANSLASSPPNPRADEDPDGALSLEKRRYDCGALADLTGGPFQPLRTNGRTPREPLLD